MKSKRKSGIFLPYIYDFINMRHNLGFKSESMERNLKAFDAFAFQEGLKEIKITKSLALKWCSRRLGEAADTFSHRTNFLRQFAIYLCNLGYDAYLPKNPPIKKDSFSPYIYSSDEMNRIFEAADRLELFDKHAQTMLIGMPLLIRMLYATGIRVGEALKLNLKDVNLNNNYLVIKGSKNGKDRIVPFSDSLAQACCQYLKYRGKLPQKCNCFFIKLNGLKCTGSSYRFWWNRILKSAGIPHRGKIAGPRIQDLRHSFCVASMYKMASSGNDLYYSLPVLSRYVGHASIASTDQYVRMTSEMYPELLNKLESICSYIFPIIKSR
jgi:integrase/recombinase XerD